MDKNTRGLILLLSLVLMVIPLFIFPSRLGLPLSSGSTLNMLYEVVFYGIVLYFFRRETNLIALLVGSALTLVYRMAMGAVFGLAIAAFFSIDLSVAMSLGMTKYLPAIILHVIAAPFIMRPLYLSLAESLVPSDSEEIRPEPEVEKEPEKPIIVPQYHRAEDAAGQFAAGPTAEENSAAIPSYSGEENQFEKAVAYLGESGAVKLAVIVDEEGLPLAKLVRGEDESELWAPFSIVLERNNQALFEKFHRPEIIDKLDIGTRNSRVILRRIERVTLMILADNNVDETIHIRIAQASDMVRRYMRERYSPSMFARVEESYVSDS